MSNQPGKINNWTPETMKRVSLRQKFLLIYVAMISIIVFLISMVLPVILNRYLIRSKVADLDGVREIVSQVLMEDDFRINPHSKKILAAAADASHVCIWVAVPQGDSAAEISVYGHLGNDMSAPDFSNFTVQEKTQVKDVIEGIPLNYSNTAFPTAFSMETISMGYSQAFTAYEMVLIADKEEMIQTTENCAVFLHVAMDDLYLTSRSLQLITFVTLLILATAAIMVTGLMANNIFIPVSNLTNAAKAVSKGDFSQQVEIKSNDEIGQLSLAFNDMTAQLRSVDTLQSDFIANISHDFRSPLTSIKGFVEAMMDGTIPPEMHEKYLQIVLDEANRLTKMTNNVLDLTKMENGQYEINKTRFDINEMIVKLALSFEKRINEKQIDIQFHFLQEKLYVYADMDLMERVVYNLLDNALKFTEKGDTITAETSIVGKKAYIVVSDTGSGIEESALPHIFDRFNKGDKSRGKNKMGTGLGLAIVKQIMLNHHEDIRVYSKVGEGTKFSFTLPLSEK